MQELIEKALRGDKLSLARLITQIERDSPQVPELLREVSLHSGRGYRVGFTGPPGSGKSTIVDQLTQLLRPQEAQGAPTIGIIAVDPTSPLTGGALLGDRIRMLQHYKDEGVFVRSMATRGSHGGIPAVTQRVAMLLDAGKDWVFIETVGVGQTELDIMGLADTVVVVLVPEAGDAIQTMKAGLMEIADIFVVNKADREGADRMANEIKGALQLSPKQSWWEVPVLLTQAHDGVGVPELDQTIRAHRRALETSGNLESKRQRRRTAEFFRTIEGRLSAGLHELLARDSDLQSFVKRVEVGEIDPYSAAADVLRDRRLLQRWLAALEG